ncbi:MAG: DUF4874 domain-containing protein [Oscillospiraceae bacterium]|nr:DUF4874 domain-containing protein [Oscillospiraceae bacterium]
MTQTFSPLYGVRSALLSSNPDRGFRLEIVMDVKQISEAGSYEAMKQEADRRIVRAMAPQPVQLAQLYLYLSGFNRGDIPPQGLTAIEACLDALREREMKALLRFAYCTGLSEKDRQNDAPQPVILRHMQQLRPVLERKKEIIHVCQAGMIGAWGEWHSEVWPLDRAVLLRSMVEELVPEDLYLQVRLPRYKNLYPADRPGYQRIGIHNDALFGRSAVNRFGTGGLDADTDQWRQLVREAARTPQDGELFWSNWNRQNDVYCDGYEALCELSEHRFTSLSILHGYLDSPEPETTTMGRWKRQPLTEDWLQSHRLIWDPAWFQDRDGSPVPRSVFDYVQDYLGYRLQARELQLMGDLRAGRTVQAALTLVNYGLSAPFNLESSLVLLNSRGEVVSSVPAGDPAQWHSRSPVCWEDDRLLTHTLTAPLQLPPVPGRYRLGFCLKNRMDQAARLANDLIFSEGINLLSEITVEA